MTTYQANIHIGVNQFPPEVNGAALLIGLGGANHKYLQGKSSTRFSVKSHEDGIVLNVKYEEVEDIATLEELVYRLILASETYKSLLDVNKLPDLPTLPKKRVDTIKSKWKVHNHVQRETYRTGPHSGTYYLSTANRSGSTNQQFVPNVQGNMQRSIPIQQRGVQGNNIPTNNIQGASMQASNIQGGSMPGSNIQGNNIQAANIQANGMQGGSNMQGNSMQGGSNMQGNSMQGGSNMQGSNMQGNNLQGAANMQTSSMQGGNNMQGGNMQQAIQGNMQRGMQQGIPQGMPPLQGTMQQGITTMQNPMNIQGGMQTSMPTNMQANMSHIQPNMQTGIPNNNMNRSGSVPVGRPIHNNGHANMNQNAGVYNPVIRSNLENITNKLIDIYGSLPYGDNSIALMEARNHLINAVLSQRLQRPQDHATFLWHAHILAHVCNSILTFSSFHQFYKMVFQYEVIANVTLEKLLVRYPSLVTLQPITSNGMMNYNIYPILPYDASIEDVFRVVAEDDWKDPKCPAHIRSFWLVPQNCKHLPRSPYCPPATWGDSDLGLPPWSVPTHGGQANNVPEYMVPREGVPAYMMATRDDGQSVVDKAPLYDDSAMKHLGKHPVGLFLQMCHFLASTDGPNMSSPHIQCIPLSYFINSIKNYIHSSPLTVLSGVSEIDYGYGAGSIVDLLGSPPYDDGGCGNGSQGYTDMKRLLIDCKKLFHVLESPVEETHVQAVKFEKDVSIPDVVEQYLIERGFTPAKELQTLLS